MINISTGDLDLSRVRDITIDRNSEGGFSANIPISIIHHSPAGWSTEYGGGCASDTALNILNFFFPGDEIECWKGRCSSFAYALHNDFKMEFFSEMDMAGGVIAKEDILTWLKSNIQG
ncbi:hypothetical protein ACFL5V_09675 [Fibrobacterota bacterium]